MAITISGQNNNDRILASDGVLDSISGFNVVGVMTAAQFDVTGKTTTNHLNIGSNIQIGNAGIITATTLIGNVTGNVNHESNLLLQISGSEKFRVGNGGQFGIAGANYGTSGQVLTSGGSGSAPTWSTIASDKITEGNTEAEVVDTGSDGHFKVTTEGTERLRIDSNGAVMIRTTTAGAHSSDLTIGGTTGAGRIMIRSANNAGGYIGFQDTTGSSLDGQIEYNHILNSFNFYIGSQERFRIHTQGMLGLSGANYGTSGQVLTSGGTGSPVSWSTISGTTINNNADNRIITGSGSANTLEGEANLTFNGGATGDAQLTVHAEQNDSGADSELILETSNDFATSVIMFKDSTAEAGSVAYNHGDNYIKFSTNGTNGGTERVRIDAGGNMNVTGIITATAFVGDFEPRNMIINGAMQINQRLSGTLTINSSSSQYPCDRWVARGEGGSKTFTIEKTSIASSGQGIRNALKVTSSQAASVGSSDIFNVRQMIEGYNIQRLNLGEAGCASMALSFTAYSSVAGTHSGAIQNSAQNRSYPFTYTLAANTWTDVKITIPPITSGSFNEAEGVGLRVVFDLGCGNNFRGTANQWNSAQDEGATGAVRILETNGATWYVTKVQLEEGAVATKFEKKLVGEEIRNCMRYYQRDLNRRAYWGSGNVSDRQFPVRFGVEMRDTPTVSFISTSLDGGSAAAYNKTRQGYNFAMTGSGRFYEWQHTASAEI